MFVHHTDEERELLQAALGLSLHMRHTPVNVRSTYI